MTLNKVFTILSVVLLLSVPATSYAQQTPAQANVLKQIAELQAMLAKLQGQSTEKQTGKSVPVPTQPSSEWQFVRPYNTVIVTAQSEGSDAVLDDWDDLTLFTLKKGQLKNSYMRTADIERSESSKAWQMFKGIAGDDFVEKHINEFMTYDLPRESTLAFVERFGTTDAPWRIYKQASTLSNGSVSYIEHRRGWGLAVNVANSDFSNTNWTTDHAVTLLHEYAHILTLNDTQVEYGMANIVQLCKKSGGSVVIIGSTKECARKGSYVQTFVTEFWDRNHSANGDNFVTQYAATNTQEDIAESFTNFVLQRRPATIEDVGDKKIEFFYRYPELVALRDRIRSNIRKYFN